MLYYKSLYSQIFDRYPKDADELKILTGYVGPTPIADLQSLGLKTTVIFGLFNENRKRTLHDQLVKLHRPDNQILYPEILSHSKCYVWLKNGVPIRALVGSANFSSNGLNNDYREVLFEVDERQASVVNGYIDIIAHSARACTDIDPATTFVETKAQAVARALEENYESGVAKLSLLTNKGEMPPKSGLNWGMSEDSNVRPNDAYIAIRKANIRLHTDVFSPRHELPPGESSRGNLTEVVELLWDDGTVMQARFEGTQSIAELGDQKYPKQLASFPNKDILGKYLRKRLGVAEGQPVTKSDLLHYGSTEVQLRLIEEGVYSAKF